MTLRWSEACALLLCDGIPVRFTAPGGSMAPAIRDGERVVVRPLDGVPRPGEVVLVSTPQGLRVHRVVRVATSSATTLVTTRGDALSAPDPSVPLSRVLGRVVAVEGRRELSVEAAPRLAPVLAPRLRSRLRRSVRVLVDPARRLVSSIRNPLRPEGV